MSPKRCSRISVSVLVIGSIITKLDLDLHGFVRALWGAGRDGRRFQTGLDLGQSPLRCVESHVFANAQLAAGTLQQVPHAQRGLAVAQRLPGGVFVAGLYPAP